MDADGGGADDPESHEEHLRLAYDLGQAFLATELA
jgi:hypothetical protein